MLFGKKKYKVTKFPYTFKWAGSCQENGNGSWNLQTLKKTLVFLTTWTWRDFSCEVRRNYFSVRAPDIWNTIPEDIRDSKTRNSLKTNITNMWNSSKMELFPFSRFVLDVYWSPWTALHGHTVALFACTIQVTSKCSLCTDTL